MKKLFIMMFFLLNLSAFANGQEWYSSPSVIWGDTNQEFRKCMEEQIILQAKYPSNTPIFWTGVLPEEENGRKKLGTLYCLIEENKCKEAFFAYVETSDGSGWQSDLSKFPTLVVVAAKDMARFIEFKSQKTGATGLVMDLAACRGFFGIQ